MSVAQVFAESRRQGAIAYQNHLDDSDDGRADEWRTMPFEINLDLRFERAARNVASAAAWLYGLAGLGLSIVDIHLGLAFVVFGGFCAQRAVAAQHRCDSLHARALAACLAEGVSDPLAEAA